MTWPATTTTGEEAEALTIMMRHDRTHTPPACLCTWFRSYRDDVALMAALGIKHYRFSVAWPRIIPDGSGAVRASPTLLSCGFPLPASSLVLVLTCACAASAAGERQGRAVLLGPGGRAAQVQHRAIRVRANR